MTTLRTTARRPPCGEPASTAAGFPPAGHTGDVPGGGSRTHDLVIAPAWRGVSIHDRPSLSLGDHRLMNHESKPALLPWAEPRVFPGGSR